MTDRELHRLSRVELLELLVQLSKENSELKAQIRELEKKLGERQIMIDNAGSIAEAALSLNGVFDAVEEAVKQYLYNIQLKTQQGTVPLSEGGRTDA